MKIIQKLFLVFAFFSAAGQTANAQCQAGFTFTVSGTTASFTDISTFSSPMNYVWTFFLTPGPNYGSQQSTNTPNPVDFLYNGDYVVSLYISDTMPSTCNSTFIDTVHITSGPNPPCSSVFTYYVDTTMFSPVQFQGSQPSYAVKWIWDFGDSNQDSTSGINALHIYTIPDTFLVMLTTITAFGDTCYYTDSVNAIACWNRLNTAFTKSINLNTVSFTANCSGANTPTYYWNFGDGNYSSQQNPVHNYTYNNFYTVFLTYGDSLGGCNEYVTDTFTLNNGLPYPCNAIFSYANDTMINSVVFHDNSTSNVVAWNWSFQAGTPSTANYADPIVSFPGPGIYYVNLIVTNASGLTCFYGDSISVGSNCLNTHAYFTMTPDTTPQVWQVNNMSTGTPNINYSWDWGDSSPISTGATPSHTYSTAGWYNICLSIVDANGCGSSYCEHDSVYRSGNAMISVYVINTGTPANVGDPGELAMNFNVYPNPATDHTSVSYSLDQSSEVELNLYDIAGRKITELENGMMKAGMHQLSLDASQIPVGVYMLRLTTDGNSVTKKLVVIK